MRSLMNLSLSVLALASAFSMSASACPVASAASSPKEARPWLPNVGDTWQIVLSNPIKIDSKKPSITPDVDVYTIDMFDNSAETVAALHKLGKKVIAYFSAGSYENWRPDAKKFKKSDLGKSLDGWEGEAWLKLGSKNVRNIMAARIKMAADKGFDAIDPDNVDGYNNANGLGLKKSDTISFMKFLAAEARKHGMSTGLKNAGEVIKDVIKVVDFQTNEQCAEYNECTTFEAFIKVGKPVFHIEYPKGAPNKVSEKDAKKAFGAKGASKFSTVVKEMNLNGWVQYKDGKKYTTKTK